MFDNFISGFTAFTKIRSKVTNRGRHSGGVTVFVKSSLVEKGYIIREFIDFNDCVVLLLKSNLFHLYTDIIMCFPYISPEGSSIYNQADCVNGIEILEDYLLQIVLKFPDALLLIAGDLNARCGSLQDILYDDDDVNFIFDEDVLYESDNFQVPRNSKDTVQNTFGRSLIELCKNFSVHIVNGRNIKDQLGEITCIANNGSSIVDYFIASSNLFQYITEFEVGKRSESVHFPLHCKLTFQLNSFSETEGSPNPDNNTINQHLSHEALEKYRWDENKKNMFLDEFKLILNDLKSRLMITVGQNLSETLDIITSMYHKAAECIKVPRRRGNSKRNELWWDTECDSIKKQKYISLRKFRQLNTSESLNDYKGIRNRFKYVCKQKKETLQANNRQELINSRSDTNLFWKTVKKFRYKQSQESDITCDQWYNHFKSLLYSNTAEDINILEENNEPVESVYDDGLHSNLNRLFTTAELTASINDMKLGKSGGPDGILPEMLKYTLHEIVPILLPFYNRILVTGYFPEPWSKSILCPIFKAGSQNDPNNFRGISLNDVFNKILTGMMHNRLSQWAEVNNKIDEAQAGFRKGYSTIDNLFVMMSLVQKYISKKGGRFYFLFIDFSKAFDRVDHVILMDCLKRKGVKGKFYNLLKSMYSNLCSCVKLNNGNCTEYFPCNIGTRQGCKLSPILFSLLINDVFEGLKNSGIQGVQVSTECEDILALGYADDLSEGSDTVRKLQSIINTTSDICHRIRMEVNMSKTKVMVFRNGGFLRKNEVWYFRGRRIETVSAYKYMGLTITPKLIWSHAKKVLATKARKSIISLYKLQFNIGYFDYSELFKLFDTMVKPVLLYGSEIWGFEISETIENVHDQFCKRYLKLPLHTTHILARGECGRYPIYIDYYCRCIKYWIKLTRMSNNRYPYHCYKMLRRLDVTGRITWATRVKEILFYFGFGYAWIYENIGDVKLFMKLFKQRLVDCSKQDWHRQINNSSKAHYYRYYMTNLTLANYISYKIPLKFRIALSRLRCSVHELNIETGRHYNIPQENRLCSLCNAYEIEDEFHFIMTCSLYDELRHTYLPHLDNTVKNVEAFIRLMNSTEAITMCLAKFIYYAFKLRKETTAELA